MSAEGLRRDAAFVLDPWKCTDPTSLELRLVAAVLALLDERDKASDAIECGKEFARVFSHTSGDDYWLVVGEAESEFLRAVDLHRDAHAAVDALEENDYQAEATGRKSVEEGKVDRLAKQLDDAADTIEALLNQKIATCADCHRIRICHLQPSVGYRDGKTFPAKPAMVCVDLDDCIAYCES